MQVDASEVCEHNSSTSSKQQQPTNLSFSLAFVDDDGAVQCSNSTVPIDISPFGHPEGDRQNASTLRSITARAVSRERNRHLAPTSSLFSGLLNSPTLFPSVFLTNTKCLDEKLKSLKFSEKWL